MKNILFACIFLFQNSGFANNPSHGFTENKGQVHDQNYEPNPSVKYILPTGGMNVVLKSNGFSYDTYKLETIENSSNNWENNFNTKTSKPGKFNMNFHRVDIEFVNASQNVQLIAEGESKDYLNFYGANLGENGITNVHLYNKITYKNIYPNIDVEFVSDKENPAKPVEYNFILRPGASINDIKLKYTGANAIELEKGKLNIKLIHGTLSEAIPLSYWKKSGKREKIHFAVSNTANETIISYEGLNKPVTETLIIDPTPNLDWATYYGEGIDDNPQAVCYDKSGNIYMGGGTFSGLNIATTGAYQSTNISPGPSAGFIAKFNRSGVRQWATFYCSAGGGITFNDLACDKFNNIFGIGDTDAASGMTTIGSYQSTLIGTRDALLVKFDGSGARQWSTYYGGYDDPTTPPDAGQGVAVDTIGNIYITGVTSSTANISTPGAFQTDLYFDSWYGVDGFLAKFNNAGSRLWATYFGGRRRETVSSICVGLDQNVYVAGFTPSQDSIGTPGTIQPVFEPSSHDAFVIKFKPNGQRAWGTYYGGQGEDYIWDMAADPYGNVLICGTTNSTYNMASTNGYQYLDWANSFVAKLKSNGQRDWGTYLSYHTIATNAWGINCDSIGCVYVTGSTVSPTLITTSGCYQSNVVGSSDAFIVKYDSAGMLTHGTLYGGNDGDAGKNICVYSQNEIYIVGQTTSTVGVTTQGSHQETTNVQNPSYTAFLAKFSNTGAVGINALGKTEKEDVFIYPNPNDGEFSVKCKEEMRLTITNELGQIIQNLQANHNTSETIKLNLNPGVYIINGQTETKSVKQKIIVIK